MRRSIELLRLERRRLIVEVFGVVLVLPVLFYRLPRLLHDRLTDYLVIDDHSAAVSVAHHGVAHISRIP